MILTRERVSQDLEAPTWEQVEAAVRDLDSETQEQFGLILEDDCYLQMSRFRGRYVCSVRANDALHTLADPDRPNTEPLPAKPGEDTWPENECFPLETALEVAKWFYEKHEPSPQHFWTLFPDGM
ncbi:MAG TPA: hypothetical protein VGE52_19735 [Pirellulales bacterium]